MGDSIATSFAANLASKLVESLVAPIGRHFGFVLCFKSYVEDLENIVNELEIAQQMVQPAVQAAENNGRLIFDYIEEWLNSVRVETQKAHNLLERGRSAENACFRGWLPNPVLRHPIGRKARRITKVIRGLIDKSQNFDLGNVSHERPPIGVVTFPIFPARSVDEEEDDLKSRASIKKKLLKALADDEVRVVGVWGAPGLGKSKLLDDIEKRVRMDQKPFDLVDWKPFDLVAMVKLSRNQDIRIIQDGIADAVGLHQMNEKTLDARACRIRERLERGPQKNILIIIDNLWEKLELKDVGIPCGDNNEVRGCKLLLSSRNRSILLDDMGCDPLSLFQLKGLEHDEARILFERIAGEKVNSPEFKAWVDGVVKNCGGLPLLIVSLAKKLKHRDLPAWRDASTNRDLSTIESQVESSYRDVKDERIRLLFLVCALGSGTISVRISLLFCMGLGLLKKFGRTIENARDVLFGDLRTLQDSSLLLESQNTEWFRMHDIIVDVAISLRDKFMDMNWRALVWRKGDHGYKESSEDDLKNCTAISFSLVGIDKLPEKLDCPNLRILLLFDGEQSLKIPESFFDSTEKLQVLDITGLSVTTLPYSIAILENIKSLSLDHCILEDVTVLGKLIRLQFLSLWGSRIARLPKEIGELTELRFLDLRMCFWLEVIDPGVLGRLVNLEDLYIDSFNRWEAEDKSPQSNASLIELKNLEKLRTLYITISRWANLPSNLPFGNLNKHKIGIEGIRYRWGVEDESNILELKLDSGDLLHEVWMQRCLQQTHDLLLEGSQDGEDSVHKLCTEGFQQLKRLCVQNNSTFKCIVDSTRCPAFTELKSLSLENLNGLENICRGALAPESFRKLNIVKVKNCSEIKHSFSSSMRRIFLQLEEIQISRCHLMEQIVADIEIDKDDDPNLKSCKLRRLTLQNLPKMTSFYKTMDHRFVLFNAQQVSLPYLESLTLSELPKLKEIWTSQFPLDMSNLRILNVENCAFLLSIFPSNLVTKLQNLETITIKRCWLIQDVFDLEGLTASGDVEILSHLTTLTLSDLPRLGHIWNKNPRRASCFRNLRVLKVQNCDNLRFLFSSSLARALGQIKEIEISSCKLMEEIIDVEGEESEEAASIHTLELPLLTSLSLKELPNLKTFSYGTIHYPTLKRLWISGCPKMMTFSSFKGKLQSMTAEVGLQQASGRVNSSLSSSALFNQNVEFPSLESLKISHMDNVEKIWPTELASNAFNKLKTLVVEYCEKLSSVFSSHTILTRFRNLKELTVTDCGSLEVVFHIRGFNVSKPRSTSTFELKELVLMRLPKMKYVWSGLPRGGLTFGCLQHMEVAECEGLESLLPSSVATSMMRLEKIFVRECGVEAIVFEEDGVRTNTGDLFFPQLTDLRLFELPKLRSFYKYNHTSTLPLLKRLRVTHCGKMRTFSFACEFQSYQGTTTSQNQPALFSFEKVVPHLEGLMLTRGDVEIAMTQQHSIFGNLRDLALTCYHDENVTFPSNFLLHSFPNLEELIVTCSSFEEIFSEDASGLGGATPRGGLTDVENPPNAFANLERLDLLKLGNLRQVWKDGSLMAEILHHIQYMFVQECPSLSIIFPSPISFQNLMQLEIEDCAGLVHMGSCSGMTSLVHLTWLTLRNCRAMKDVVKDDGNGAEEISFPELEELILDDLPSLESFSPTNYAFRFPALVRIVVTQCPKMTIFCKGASRAPNLDKVLLSDRDDEWRWEGDLDTTIRTLST